MESARFATGARSCRAALVFVFVVAIAGCLREPASEVGLNLGYAVDPTALQNDERYRDIIAADAAIVTPENHTKWGLIHPEPDVYDFAAADQIVASAAADGQSVRGHVLVWHNQLPAWIENGDWTRETLIEVMEDHITTVVGHFRDDFPGVVTQWDVVNEALLPDGSRRPTLFQEVIGDDYIDLAFQFAHAADPSVELYYNDFYSDTFLAGEVALTGVPAGPGASATRSSCDDVPKCVATRDLIAGLLTNAVPIDGVGFQAHWLTTDVADYTTFASWTVPLGIKWALTEIDIGLVTNTSEALDAQGIAMRSLVEDCVVATNCDTAVFWGVTDKYSWLPSFTGGVFDHGLLYDEQGRPKPAVAHVLALLNE